jgi:phosphate/sulfate permease
VTTVLAFSARNASLKSVMMASSFQLPASSCQFPVSSFQSGRI